MDEHAQESVPILSLVARIPPDGRGAEPTVGVVRVTFAEHTSAPSL